MNKLLIPRLLIGLAFLSAAADLRAQELFRDQMTNGASWSTNADTDTSATFNYDYSADGIPEAPNSRGGDSATRGVKMEANIVLPAEAAAQTIYPTGQSFTGNYQLRFDAWINYDVDERQNGGAAGTTEFIGGGVGYDDTAVEVGPGAQMLATGDGGSGSDWRIFADGAFLGTDEMDALTRNGFDAHYSDFLTSVAPPASQMQGAVTTVAGSPGLQWVTFEITTYGDVATMYVEKPNGDRLHIAHYYNDVRPFTSDGNVGVIYADFFSSVTARPDRTFAIVDNVEVHQVVRPTVSCPDLENEVADCSYEASPLTAWTLVAGEGTSLSQSPREALEAIGSAQIESEGDETDFAATIQSDCFAVTESPNYGFEAQFRLTVGDLFGGSCATEMRTFSDGTCTIELDSHVGNTVAPADTTTSAPWLTSGAIVDTTGASFARLFAGCRAPAIRGPSFEPVFVQVDGVLAGPAPQLSIVGPVTMNEGDAGTTMFSFTVNREGSSSGTAGATYTVTGSGGTPAAASDFVGAVFPSGPVSFADGESSVVVDIPVQGDVAIEGDDQFTVTLSSPVDAALGQDTAVGTITNDDSDAPLLTATKEVSSLPAPGDMPKNVIYEIQITNVGTAPQIDAPMSDEFADQLPPELDLVSAISSSGAFPVVADLGTNTVTGNGTIAVSETVVITIEATILASFGTEIVNQGALAFDADNDGTNDSVGSTDEPALPGDMDPTTFLVPGSPLEIPTAGTWALLGLALLLAGFGVLRLRI